MGNVEFEENNSLSKNNFNPNRQGYFEKKRGGIAGLFISLGIVKSDGQSKILMLVISIIFFGISIYILLN